MSKTEGSDPLSQDRVFDLLSNARRRFVLHYLSSRSDPVELRELAEEVARWETGDETLSPQQRKRVYVSLYQTHIPRLAEAGVIEYDSDSGLVRLVDRARDIDQYVKTTADDRAWPLYYIGVSVLGVFLYLMATVDLLPFVTGLIAGLITLGLLLAISIAHLVSSRRKRVFRMETDQLVRRRED